MAEFKVRDWRFKPANRDSVITGSCGRVFDSLEAFDNSSEFIPMPEGMADRILRRLRVALSEKGKPPA